ncbi:MAG: DUF4394 domain-containing protein [Blastocatellia bacterium]|nr:DUF4394 domain-containing protein [Blastocatellia bacterium]
MKQRRIVFVLVVMISMIMSLPGMGRAQKLKGSRAGARAKQTETIKSVDDNRSASQALKFVPAANLPSDVQLGVSESGDLQLSIMFKVNNGPDLSVSEEAIVFGLERDEKLIGVVKKPESENEAMIIGISNLGRVYEITEIFARLVGKKGAETSRIGNIELPIADDSKHLAIAITDLVTCELQVIDSNGKNFLVSLKTEVVSQVFDVDAVAAARRVFFGGSNLSNHLAPLSNSVSAIDDRTFYIDSKTDAFFSSTIPVLGNRGLTKIGDLGMDITSSAGMDFDSQGNLFATLTKEGESHSNLYQIDLETGQPTLIAELDSVLESLSIIEGVSVSISTIDPLSAKIPFTSTEQQTLTATLLRDDGEPLADTAVNITVEGVNNFSVQDVTDGEGKVTLTYKNDSGQSGIDVIFVVPQEAAANAVFEVNEGIIDSIFVAVPATVVWSAGPFINNIKVKGGGKKITLTGLQFRPDDQVFINGQQIPAKLVKFKGEGNILLKLKGRRGEFLNPCAGSGSSNTLTITSSEGETEEATFIACP